MTGTITSTLGTLTTADKPILTGTATWNDAAVTFYGVKIDITNTASAATSFPVWFGVGGTGAFAVNRSAQVQVEALLIRPLAGGLGRIATFADYFGMGSAGYLGWASGTDGANGHDTAFYRYAAGIIEINNGTAGTFRDLKLRNLFSTGQVTIGGTSASSSAGEVSIGGVTRTTIGANGAASALTALPLGYIDAYVGSTAVQIPYYSRGA
jgi:hypothetical protein